MEEDDLSIPPLLKLTAEERRRAWDGRQLKPVDPRIPPRKRDPATEAFAAEQERIKKVRQGNRLARLEARRSAGIAPSTKTHYWDSLRNRWARDVLYRGGKMMEDVTNMAGPDLVRLYNQMAVEAAGLGLQVDIVRRFKTLAVGVRRCTELDSKIIVAKGGEPPPPPTTVEAEEPETATTEEEEAMRKTSGSRKAAAKKAKSVRSTKKATASARKAAGFEPEARITLLVKENPRREGTRAHKVYGYYSTCKTVAEFVKKGGAGKDLKWDVEHKNIKVG